MNRAQGSLEYLAIIAVVIGIAAIVSMFAMGSFSAQKESYIYSTCRQAASTCNSTHILNASDPCLVCNTACNYTNGTEIFPNAARCCKFGNTPAIYTGSSGCTGCLSDSECSGSTPKCDLYAHTCVQCFGLSDCAAGQKCCDKQCKSIYNTADDCMAGVSASCVEKDLSGDPLVTVNNAGKCTSSCTYQFKPLGTSCGSASAGYYCQSVCRMCNQYYPRSCNSVGQCIQSLNLVTSCWNCIPDTKCDININLYGCTSSLGSCTTPAAYCGDGIKNGAEECDGTDDATCPGKCRTAECLCEKNQALLILHWRNTIGAPADNLEIRNSADFSTIAQYFSFINYSNNNENFNLEEAAIKAAETDTDGETEIVIMNNARDNTDQKTITIFEKVTGALKVKKKLILNSGYFVDFAIIDWNKNGKPDLALLNATNPYTNDGFNAITIFYDIVDKPYGTTLYNSNADVRLGYIESKPYSLIKATYIDGEPSLVIGRVGADGWQRREWPKWTYETTQCYFRVYHAGDTQPSKFFYLDPPAVSGGGNYVCADFDFVDWDSDNNKELTVLTRASNLGGTDPLTWWPNNQMYIINMSKIAFASGLSVYLADDSQKRYTAVNMGDKNAGEIYVEDIDADGKDEILLIGGQGDIIVYSNKNNLIGTKIDDADTAIKDYASSGDVADEDLASIDWNTLKVPRIA